jgi:hypothetical protein
VDLPGSTDPLDPIKDKKILSCIIYDWVVEGVWFGG